MKCLRLGVALHHGALPTAYRKEIERLLRDNVLKVTISSPTLAQGLGGDIDQLVEYVVNNAAAWTFPEVANERPQERERALADWERHVATLDTAILSLIGENDIPEDGIEAALDDILQSSLWHRRLQRQHAPIRQVLRAALVSRSRLIWNQSTAARRRGYFLAGVGLADHVPGRGV